MTQGHLEYSKKQNKTKNKPYKCCCHRAALACFLADLELSTCVSVWVGEGRIDWAGKSKPSCSVYKWMEVELAKLSSLTYLYCITEHNNIAYNVQFKQIQAMQTHYTTLRHLASMMAARAVPCVIEHFPDGPASGHWIAQSINCDSLLCAVPSLSLSVFKPRVSVCHCCVVPSSYTVCSVHKSA